MPASCARAIRSACRACAGAVTKMPRDASAGRQGLGNGLRSLGEEGALTLAQRPLGQPTGRLDS